MQLLAVFLTLAALAVIVFFISRLDRSAGFRLALPRGDVGAVTLAQANLHGDPELARGIVEAIIEENRIFDRLPLKAIGGNALKYDEEATLPNVAFRSVNEAYVESTGTIVQRTESLTILGGDLDVDRFLVATEPPDAAAGIRATQTALKAKALSMTFNDAFFNGDVVVNPKQFDGLKKRLTGTQVIDAGVNGLGPVAGGHDFFDRLDDLLASVNGDVSALYANRNVRFRILSSGRRLNANVEAIPVSRDADDQRRDLYYNGIPVLDAGNRTDGTPILGLNETQGTATTASSIYAVRFGEDVEDRGVTGLYNGTAGIDVRDLGEISEKPVFRTRMESYVGLATFGGRAAARLRGVLNA
jgi:hypothetical protein